MTNSWQPDDEELLAVINDVVNWPADDDRAPVTSPAPEGFAEQVFTMAFELGYADEEYTALVDDASLSMRAGPTDDVQPFRFGNDELSAEGELGPGDLIIGVVIPPGLATVRIDSLSGARSVDTDDLGRFEIDTEDRVVRLVVTRGDTVRTSGWMIR